jgi:hypothetical protein
MSTTIFDAVTANSSKTITTFVDDLTTGGAGDALSAEQGVTLKGLVDINTAKVTNVSTDLSITGTTEERTIVSSDGTDAIIPVATTLESGLMSTTIFDAVTALTNKKQSYLQTDTFSETNGTASAHTLTKAVTPTATNEVNFKVSINGGVVSATAITYDSDGNTITLSGISVSQYDVVTVVYTTNE